MILRKVLQSALKGYHCRTWKKFKFGWPSMHDFCYILLLVDVSALFTEARHTVGILCP